MLAYIPAPWILWILWVTIVLNFDSCPIIETTSGLKMCMAILACTLDSLNLLAIEAWDLFKTIFSKWKPNVVVCINSWSNIHESMRFSGFPLDDFRNWALQTVGSTLNTWWIPGPKYQAIWAPAHLWLVRLPPWVWDTESTWCEVDYVFKAC